MSKFFRLLCFALLILGPITASAAPIKVKPIPYYFVNNDRSQSFTTFQGAYDVAKAQRESARDPSTGLAHWRAVGVEPTNMVINGDREMRIALEVLEYNNATNQYDKWVPSPGAGSGLLSYGYECPQGFTRVAYPYVLECHAYGYPEPCDPCGGVGNPILPSTRMKIQEEVDYRSAGPGGLEFVRTYRSDRNGWEHNYSIAGVDLALPTPAVSWSPGPVPPEPRKVSLAGCHWGITSDTGKFRCFSPMRTGANNDFQLRRGNGRLLKFGGQDTLFPAADINDRWTPVFESNAKVAHDVYNASTDSTERYGLNGLIQKITQRNGQVTRFDYEPFDGPQTAATPELVLVSVTDHFGRALRFSYNIDGRLATMTTPANDVFIYSYDEASGGGSAIGNLTSVTYPDQTRRVYWYNEQAHTSGQNRPFALTGITDENGIRFATYNYDTSGFALSTERAGGLFKYKVTADGPYRAVSDPLGHVSNYQYEEKQGSLRLIYRTYPAGAGYPVAAEFTSYDTNGNKESFTNVKGATTKYTYDLARNLEKSRIDAFGKPEQRTTTTEWHTTFRLPDRVAEPKRRTTYTYHPNGELKTRTIQATTDASGASAFAAALTGTARTWTYAYNAQWQLASVTGPVTTDVTTYAYDAVTGDLQTVTNAAGHVTRFEEYDGNGRAGLITQPNGVKTRMRYSPRGWLESMTVSDGGVDLVTTYSYDNVGQLKTVTMPSRSVITYTYDDAHRLTDVADAKGNKIHYVLDNMGNRISEEVTDPSGNLRRQLTREFDALNRLRVQTGGAQ